jgi:drug/metabolite transporter (DMT)-like permease
MHPSLLLRLASQKTYLIGIGCQIIGFFLAFLARRDLPLFLVQASVSAGLGVMAILGVAVLKWRLPRAEIALLALLGAGVAGLVVSAKPGASRPITTTGIIALVSVLGVIALLGVFATRLRGVRGSVALGALAGLAFGAAAVDSRALAAAHSWQAFALHPLLYLLFAHSLTGQLMLGMAMQRGSTTAAVAAMDAASTAPAAIIGLALLGDQIWPGRQWLAAIGFICTLVAVIGLTRFAQPQHGHPNADTVVFAAVAALPPVSHPSATAPASMSVHQKPGAHRKGAVRNPAIPVGLAKNRATAR